MRINTPVVFFQKTFPHPSIPSDLIFRCIRKFQVGYQIVKDDTVTFEELGVDRLFVDEAHSFKNLYMHTKMRNVAGISQTDAQKSSDMFAKCRYMDDVISSRRNACGSLVQNLFL